VDWTDPELPDWAMVGERRRAHVQRVTALLGRWADALAIDDAERALWYDAGRLHDALRDAPEPMLRELAADDASVVELLHGPAAAAMLESRGETRRPLLDAVRWHTIGSPAWERVGRALYMADFLEPGRKFAQPERALLARAVPVDFDAVFREVLRQRLEWSIREGKTLFPATVDLWNRVR